MSSETAPRERSRSVSSEEKVRRSAAVSGADATPDAESALPPSDRETRSDKRAR